MISLNDILLAMSNIPVDDPIAEIWGRGLQGGYKIIEYTGFLPITITANGDVLLDYRIYGADGGVGERADITGLSEPLCGIQTYTDSLDLSTGILTRKIKKVVLTGTESIYRSSCYDNTFAYNKPNISTAITRVFSTHFEGSDSVPTGSSRPKKAFVATATGYVFSSILFGDWQFSGDVGAFRAWIAQQYAAGTPVTVWYVLAEPDVSTISMPSGLTGIIEGYLMQDGTPTPETPIYPTANGVKQADGTYNIEYGYKLPMTIGDGNTVQNVPVYIGENQLTEGEYVSYVEQKIYRDVSGTLTPTDPPVPLPEIPTINGETVIDYDGDPKPPQMYVKYKG